MPKHPPVLLVGGVSNALAVARSLGSRGIEVFALNDDDAYIRRSRFAHFIPLDYADGYAKSWERYLLSERSDHLRGAVLLPLVDEAIGVVIEHQAALSKKFILEESDSDVRRGLLDKLGTYDRATKAGVPTPWYVQEPQELEQIEPAQRFPLILKPRLSHEFRKRYRAKYVRVDSPQELNERYQTLQEQGLSVVLMQFIPGGDELLCSYYSYLDEHGQPLFHFTKRVFRRDPPNMGPATYHITDDIPEARELGLRFFQHVGLRGLGNVEFKRDERDGRLKLIECNARFTEGTCLAHASGSDMAWLVYSRLTGLPLPDINDYRSGMRMINPLRDFLSYKELKARGELTTGGWLSSLLHPQTFPYFDVRDPLPSLHAEASRAGGFVSRRLARILGREAD